MVRLHYSAYGKPHETVVVEQPIGPIFHIASLPQLTPMPAQLPSAIDAEAAPTPTDPALDVAPAAAEPSSGRLI